MRRRWKILIGIGVALAAALAINTITADTETKPAEVTVEGGRILHLPSGDVQVTDDGPTRRGASGPPIVLIHCYGCSLHWWDRVVPTLARDHRVIRIDLLGFGGSEKPSGGYSMPEQAELVAAALDQLGVRQAVVVGHSLGFDVTTALADQHPELTRSLVDVDESADTGDVEIPFLAKVGFLPVIGEAGWRLAPDFAIRDNYGVAFAPGYDLSSGFDNPDQVVDDYRAMTYTSYDQSIDEYKDFEDARALDDRLKGSGLPLLVIFGTEDQNYTDPIAAARRYEDVPGARVVLIEGSGHSPIVEKPRHTARLIMRFANQRG